MFARPRNVPFEPFDIHLSTPKTVAFWLLAVVVGVPIMVIGAWMTVAVGNMFAAVVGALFVATGMLTIFVASVVLHRCVTGKSFASVTRDGVWGTRMLRQRFIEWSPDCSFDMMNRRAVVLRRWDPNQSWGERWFTLLWRGGEAVVLRTNLCSMPISDVLEALHRYSPYPVYEGMPPPPPSTEGEARVNAIVFHPVTRVLFILFLVALAIWVRRL